MKQNGVVCLPGPALLFFIFRFEYLVSGPVSYRDFRETSPLGPGRLSCFPAIMTLVHAGYLLLRKSCSRSPTRFRM